MTAWWPHHVKHPDLVNYYRDYEWIKTTYTNFFSRIVKCWESKEEAIKLIRRVKKPRQIKWLINEQWRECIKCLEYKVRELYHRSTSWVYWRTSDCIECRNKAKREYRASTNYAKDKELKTKKRKLELWEKLSFHHPIIVNWNPREVIWEVKEYKMKKWYLIYSQLLKQYKWLDTNDNHARNKNCKKFYKIKEQW